jgi:hypothetical protein
MLYAEEIILHLIKGAGWLAENFPDDPRLVRRRQRPPAFVISCKMPRLRGYHLLQPSVEAGIRPATGLNGVPCLKGKRGSV